MTDVKFMDLSQNDNPATTDSVLIGNSTNGLKRTTVGAIGNLFAVSQLLHFEKVTGQTVPTPANPSKKYAVQVNAPSIPGYSFKFWLSPSTSNDQMPVLMSDNLRFDSIIWVMVPADKVNVYKSTPIPVAGTAVYVKSSVA